MSKSNSEVGAPSGVFNGFYSVELQEPSLPSLRAKIAQVSSSRFPSTSIASAKTGCNSALQLGYWQSSPSVPVAIAGRHRTIPQGPVAREHGESKPKRPVGLSSTDFLKPRHQ